MKKINSINITKKKKKDINLLFTHTSTISLKRLEEAIHFFRVTDATAYLLTNLV